MNLQKPRDKPQFKIKVKVTIPYKDNPKRGRKAWAHFAYVDTGLYVRYMAVIADQGKSERVNMQNAIIKWYEEDFGLDTDLSTFDELVEIRRTIVESMQPEFPDIYRNDYVIDRQGWIKLWVTRHMKKELKENINEQRKYE